MSKVHAAREREPEPKRSPARQALANAIIARDEAKHRVQEARDAVERSVELVTAAERKLQEANGAAKAGRDRLAEQIAASAKSGTGLPPGTLARELRIAECDAQDQFDAARKAQEISRAALSAVDATLASAERRLVEAADAVIATDPTVMLDEMESLQQRLMVLRITHRFLRRNHLYTDRETERRGEKLCHWEFPGPSEGIEHQSYDRHPKHVEWVNARAALLLDPDAPAAHRTGFPATAAHRRSRCGVHGVE